jgi:hypothetical protein
MQLLCEISVNVDTGQINLVALNGLITVPVHSQSHAAGQIRLMLAQRAVIDAANAPHDPVVSTDAGKCDRCGRDADEPPHPLLSLTDPRD